MLRVFIYIINIAERAWGRKVRREWPTFWLTQPEPSERDRYFFGSRSHDFTTLPSSSTRSIVWMLLVSWRGIIYYSHSGGLHNFIIFSTIIVCVMFAESECDGWHERSTNNDIKWISSLCLLLSRRFCNFHILSCLPKKQLVLKTLFGLRWAQLSRRRINISTP